MLLLETIKIKDNQLYNIQYHNQRMNNARKKLFNCHDFINIEEIIEITKVKETVKCRIVYNETIKKIEYEPYKIRNIKTLKIVRSDSINYEFKYYDRSELNKFLELKKNCDDILIVKNNRITDTTFSNIAFYDGAKWLTPSFPLLKGTKREKLLDDGKIAEEDIFLSDLKKFRKAILFNSMIEMEDDIVIEIKNII